MDDKTDKKNKITWWHLVVAGGGINILYGIRHSSPPFLMLILADFLSVVGTGWGILLLIKYLLKKYGKNKFAKVSIVAGIFLGVAFALFLFRFLLFRFVPIENLTPIEQNNTVLYQNCLNEASKAYKDYKIFSLNDYCSKNKIIENCALPPDQEHFINGLFDLAKEDCVKNYPQK